MQVEMSVEYIQGETEYGSAQTSAFISFFLFRFYILCMLQPVALWQTLSVVTIHDLAWLYVYVPFLLYLAAMSESGFWVISS